MAKKVFRLFCFEFLSILNYCWRCVTFLVDCETVLMIRLWRVNASPQLKESQMQNCSRDSLTWQKFLKRGLTWEKEQQWQGVNHLLVLRDLRRTGKLVPVVPAGAVNTCGLRVIFKCNTWIRRRFILLEEGKFPANSSSSVSCLLGCQIPYLCAQELTRHRL